MKKAWKIAEHSVLKDKQTKEELFEIGFSISGNIGETKINQLRRTFESLHDFKQPEGGMFYSLYSNDLAYRNLVNKELISILQFDYDNLFENYKTVINSFIVKLPGPKSDFTLHQDSTGLDEYKYSPLSVWIPLQDTSLKNGTICVIPKTHGFFHPYRGISFASPFKNYEDVLRKFLFPIELKAGDILLFDNRLVHYSHLNQGQYPRIVVMSGIFPKEAEIISVFKDESEENSPLEIYKQSEDFLITNTAFYENCTARPYRGDLTISLHEPLEEISVYDFLSWASKNKLNTTDIPQLTQSDFNMQIISEPK
jgi:hypothetical protein